MNQFGEFRNPEDGINTVVHLDPSTFFREGRILVYKTITGHSFAPFERSIRVIYRRRVITDPDVIPIGTKVQLLGEEGDQWFDHTYQVACAFQKFRLSHEAAMQMREDCRRAAACVIWCFKHAIPNGRHLGVMVGKMVWENWEEFEGPPAAPTGPQTKKLKEPWDYRPRDQVKPGDRVRDTRKWWEWE